MIQYIIKILRVHQVSIFQPTCGSAGSSGAGAGDGGGTLFVVMVSTATEYRSMPQHRGLLFWAA